MRQLLVVIFAIIFIPSTYLSAQKIGVGVRGGVDFNTSDISRVGATIEKKNGFQAGIATEIGIYEAFDIVLATDLLFSQQRYSLILPTTGESGLSFHYEVNTLELPIDIRKEFRIAKVKPFVQAGPYLRYILSGKIKDGENDPSLEFGGADRFDVGVNVGVGCKLPYGIQLMAAYNHGFMKMNTRHGNDLFPVKNRKFSISAAYLFNL